MPQYPKDEPASILLERTCAEQAKRDVVKKPHENRKRIKGIIYEDRICSAQKFQSIP